LDIILELAQTQIRFVLIGGLAMQYHGSNYQTEDADISFAMDHDNLELLIDWITPLNPRPLGFPPNSNFQISIGLLERARFLIIKTDIGSIDLLKYPDGIDSFEGLWDRSKIVEVNNRQIRIASIDDLISMKKAANRQKDQIHLLELYALKKLGNDNP
jgi:predicted nucleotidyltransferase